MCSAAKKKKKEKKCPFFLLRCRESNMRSNLKRYIILRYIQHTHSSIVVDVVLRKVKGERKKKIDGMALHFFLATFLW